MSAPAGHPSRAHESAPLALPAWLESRVLLAAQAAILLLITAIVVTKYWSDHVWLGWLLLAVAALLWWPELRVARDRRWWFVYVAGIFAYTILRSYADETAIPVRTDYAIRFDHWLPGPSPIPGVQERFFERTSIGWLDYAMVGVHWSFFLAPHLGAVLVFLFRRDLFARYVVLMAGIMYLGLALFFLLPTTPPWLAAQEGALPGAFRVMDFVGGKVSGDSYQSFYASLGEPNSVAAVPSIHMAVTFSLYLWARDHAPRWALPLLAYSAVMGFALVYLAEHYVFDELVGIGCAMVVYALARRVPLAWGSGREPVEAGRGSPQPELLRPHDHLAPADE